MISPRLVLLFSTVLFANIVFSADKSLSQKKPSESKKKSEVSIKSIEYKIFDRQTGKLLNANEAPSNPYGMHNDVYVEVKLDGNYADYSVGVKLVLTATTPKTNDEARGEYKATKQSFTKNKIWLTEQGNITTIPFILNHECNTMTIKAELPDFKISKEIKADLACAE